MTPTTQRGNFSRIAPARPMPDTMPTRARIICTHPIMQDEELLRSIDLEVETPSSIPLLVDWSRVHREPFRRQRGACKS